MMMTMATATMMTIAWMIFLISLMRILMKKIEFNHTTKNSERNVFTL